MFSDHNGVMYVEDTDDISPLNALLNALQQSVSDSLDAGVRIWFANTTAERDALASTMNPSPANPLVVWRRPASRDRYIEYTMDGTTWVSLVQPIMGRRARFRTSDVSVSNATLTTTGGWSGLINNEDPNGDWTIVSGSTTRANFSGMARIKAHLTYSTNGNGVRLAQIHKNGESNPVKIARVQALSGYATDLFVEWEGSVQEGDDFTIVAWQNSGTTLSLQSARNGLSFMAERTA